MDRTPGGQEAKQRRGRLVPRGLTGRLYGAAALVILLIGSSFAGLLWAIVELRAADTAVSNSATNLRAAFELEKLLIDMETGLRGFVITREEQFLEPWNAGRDAFPSAAEQLASQESDSMVQAARLAAILSSGRSYIDDYGTPLIEAARNGDPSASSVSTTQQGKSRVDELRSFFAGYTDTEREIYLNRLAAADRAAQVATLVATAALGASVLFILAMAAYFARAVFRPVTRAADMAGQLAEGELSIRMPETGIAEIATLEHSFNSLAASLERTLASQRRLLDQQMALRRVATLVAQGAAPTDVFYAVVREVVEHLPADMAYLGRYEPDETLVPLAGWDGQQALSLPERLPLVGDSVTARVWRTRAVERLEVYSGPAGSIAEHAGTLGIKSSVGGPVVVSGQLWGVLAASSRTADALPADAGAWLSAFTELVGTAIANADARTELARSRARIVEASDETRRRIERNLHDGAQQRLVSLSLQLRTVESELPPDAQTAGAGLRRLATEINAILDELRETSRGIYPAILSRGGLNSALKTLARRSPVPVELDLRSDATYPEPIQVAAYYVVAEALTNTAKHAHAETVEVRVEERDGMLRVSVRDDGGGGANPGRGSGLTGLRDRVEALGGHLELASPPGKGTTLVAELPIG
jgi:signal transduction histidine kinase